MILALCFFLTGAVVGLYMLWRHLKRRPLPKLAAVLHGFAGATGFGVLLATVAASPNLTIAKYALVVFIAAILLGVVNIVFHIRGKRHRTILILIHGLTAVAGAVTLLYGIIVFATTERTASATPTTVASSAPGPSSSASAVVVASAKEPAPAHPPTETPAPTGSAQTPPPPSNGMHPGVAWAGEQVTFVDDSSVLSATARASLADVAKDLQKHAEVTLVEVQGHADERGTDAHNLDLTRSRASAVIDALAAAGVARSRLRGVGYGASCPADVGCEATPAPASCHQPSSWQKSRRVVFLVLEAGGEHFHGKVACDRAASLIPKDDQPYATP